MSSYMNILDFGDKFHDLVIDQSEWSQATFGADSERGPLGALRHLEKEAIEAQAEVENGTGNLLEELADCLLLILDASRRAGVKPTRLVEAAQAKMIVNKSRKWPKPISDIPVEHIHEELNNAS